MCNGETPTLTLTFHTFPSQNFRATPISSILEKFMSVEGCKLSAYTVVCIMRTFSFNDRECSTCCARRARPQILKQNPSRYLTHLTYAGIHWQVSEQPRKPYKSSQSLQGQGAQKAACRRDRIRDLRLVETKIPTLFGPPPSANADA